MNVLAALAALAMLALLAIGAVRLMRRPAPRRCPQCGDMLHADAQPGDWCYDCWAGWQT
jgi:hypothetical protein